MLMLNTVEQQMCLEEDRETGSKGYPLKVGSEVGGTWLLWDETHLLEPKQKPAKCIWGENKMWTAEKDTENNKGGPLGALPSC